MPGSDNMLTRFSVMPASPTNPPDNFFSTSNASPAPVDIQPAIVPPVAWSIASQQASHESASGVDPQFPSWKELSLGKGETPFTQNPDNSTNTRWLSAPEERIFPATSLVPATEPATPQKGRSFIYGQNTDCSSGEASRAFTQMLCQLRGPRTQPAALEYDQSIDGASANKQALAYIASATEGSTIVLAPPPGLGPRIVRSAIPLPFFEVAPCVELPDSPAGANAEEYIQPMTPVRPNYSWAQSQGSEPVDMSDVSAQLVKDSSYTNIDDFIQHSQESLRHFVGEPTTVAQMAGLESDYWAREAEVRTTESAWRFAHLAHSFLNGEDSSFTREDSPERSPSPIFRTAPPRRLFSTPGHCWGTMPDAHIDNDNWIPGYFSDEVHESDGSNYSPQYTCLSSPVVCNPPGSVAPPGILGHIRDDEVSGEALNDHVQPIVIRPFLQPLSGVFLPASPSSLAADEVDYLYGFRSTTPTPAPRFNLSATSAGSNISTASLNELEPSPLTHADQEFSYSVTQFVRSDFCDSYALLNPEDRPSSPSVEDQVPEDPTLARDSSELDSSFAYDYTPEYVQPPRVGHIGLDAYTLSSLGTSLSPGAGNAQTASYSCTNTLAPIIPTELLQGRKQWIPPLKSLHLPWTYARQEGQITWGRRSGILPLFRKVDEEYKRGERKQDNPNQVGPLEQRELEACLEQNQMLESDSDYEADVEDAV
ncbi:hypothetical protein BDV93DRAFT_544115 [Ceratobasidium sp. AG-I]|nr:hypothetical protein BDV93DRAFT_544115 [Ceratobasidium sp. AG-I]